MKATNKHSTPRLVFSSTLMGLIKASGNIYTEMLIYAMCNRVLLNSSVPMMKIRLIMLCGTDLHNKIYC